MRLNCQVLSFLYLSDKVSGKLKKLAKLVKKTKFDDIIIKCLKRKMSDKSKINMNIWKEKFIKKYNANDAEKGLNYIKNDKQINVIRAQKAK